MKTKPAVSIRIPAYNHEDYIEACIMSILNQTFQDFEIVIVDDGSNDNTVEKIRGIKDDRIILEVFEQNSGMNAAVERCVQLSRGKYIANISSDDTWEPTKLEKQVTFLENNPQFDAVFTRVRFIGEEGNLLEKSEYTHSDIFECENRSSDEWLRRFFLEGNCLCNPSVMIKKEVYEELDYQDKRLVSLSDMDLWVKFCLNHKLWIIDERLTNFRIRNNEMNLSSDSPGNKSRMLFEYKQILDHYLKITDVDRLLRIFPECIQYGTPTSETIPYFLGRLAIDSHWVFRKLWGSEKIFTILKDSTLAKFIKENFNFCYVDFYRMTKRVDFTSLSLSGEFEEKPLTNNVKHISQLQFNSYTDIKMSILLKSIVIKLISFVRRIFLF